MTYRWGGYIKADEREDYEMEGGFHESCDPRDATPDPPAYLDPHFVLRMQRRVKRYIETGDLDWVTETLNQRKI